MLHETVLPRPLHLVVLAAALAGCFGDFHATLPDASDVPIDRDASAPEVAIDSSVDVQPDLAADAVPDAMPDAMIDVTGDGSADAPGEASVDATPDVVSTDVPVDVDAASDTPDATPMDVVADVAADALPDASAPDAAMDVVAVDSGPPDPSVPPPRLVAPLSVMRVGRRVRFVLSLAGGTDGATVELCRDRLCLRPELTLTATGDTVTTATDVSAGYHWWRARGRRGGSPGTVASPVWEFYVPPWRAGSAAQPPRAWAAMPDLDNDGRGDLLVAAPSGVSVLPSTRGGLAYLYRGTLSGFVTTPAVTYNTVPTIRSGYGLRVTPLHDLDGDGDAELAVSGATYTQVFSGVTSTSATPLRTYEVWNTAAPAGDLNGDGYGDMLLSDGTRVGVFLGGASGPATTSVRSVGGSAGVGVGDLNGDGFGDIAVQAGADRVSVFFGGPVGLDTVAVYSVDAPRGYVLGRMALAGDVNSDGVPDLVFSASALGAAGPSNAAVVFLAPNASRLLTPVLLTPPAGRVLDFGAAVGAAGDVTGDGVDDLVVGTGVNDSTYNNYACIFAGASPTPALAPTQCISQPGTGRYGSSVGAAGDIDRDGFEDLLVGARGDTLLNRGAVRVYRGRASGVVDLAPDILTGDTGAAFGADLAGWR